MRSYPIQRAGRSTGWRARQAANVGMEWDISQNLPENFMHSAVASLIAFCKASCEREGSIISYMLIGGIENAVKDANGLAQQQYGNTRPPSQRQLSTDGKNHVHIALIVKEPIPREAALSLIRRLKTGPEYCAKADRISRDRNPYLGWKLHHTKANTKLDDTKRILYEYGTLPLDELTPTLVLIMNKRVAAFGAFEDAQEWFSRKRAWRQTQREEEDFDQVLITTSDACIAKHEELKKVVKDTGDIDLNKVEEEESKVDRVQLLAVAMQRELEEEEKKKEKWDDYHVPN